MAMSKVSSREAKTALNAAASMASVFRDAGELAKERELKFVCEQLSNNETLLFRLSGLLKDDSLIALLDGRMNATVQKDDEGPGSGKSPKPASAVVRQAWKKWEHIEGATSFLNRLVRAAWGLEMNDTCPAELLTDGQPPANKQILGWFLMITRQKSQWRMPHHTHEEGAIQRQHDMYKPCRHRVLETMYGFKPFNDWKVVDFLNGYYTVLDNDEGIACTLLLPNGEICIYKQDGASDYFVNNPYEPDSDYSFMLKGSRARMEGLSGYFEEKGITFPEMTEWKFDGVELKGVLEPSNKKRKADDDNGLEPSAASSGSPPNKAPRVATVAAALRHRLAKREPAGGTPVNTEEEARDEVSPPSRRRISGKM